MGPTYHKMGDKVELFINKVQSDHTQLPYSYFELPFTCPANERSEQIRLSLGQVLRGDRIVKSDHNLVFGQNSECLVLCERLVDKAGILKAQDLISQNYSNEWIIDDLPSATTFLSKESGNHDKFYVSGFPIGYSEKDRYYLNNHVLIVIRFHREILASESSPEELFTIVGFEVYPKSISDAEDCLDAQRSVISKDGFELVAQGDKPISIPYSYSVYWREEPDIEWQNRWNFYINRKESIQIHYFSIANSVIFVSVFAVILGGILTSVMQNDLKIFRQGSFTHHDTKNLSFMVKANFNNWKKLKTDLATISPDYCFLLSIFAGSGVQLLATVLSVMMIFAFKILGNNVGGQHLSYSISLFILCGILCGYVTYFCYDKFTVKSQRTSKDQSIIKDSSDWFRIAFFSEATLSGFIITTILFLNFFIWAKESSTALPFGTILVLVVLYFFIEIPLALIGGWLAYKRSASETLKNTVYLPAPVTSPISSPVLAQAPKTFVRRRSLSNHNQTQPNSKQKRSKSINYGQKTPKINEISKTSKLPGLIETLKIAFAYGLIPFLCFYIELYHIYRVIWLEKNSFYYLYGFLLVTTILLIILVTELTIVSLYRQFNHSNFSWHWRSFIVGGSTSIYVCIYSFYYYFKNLFGFYDVVSTLLYFTYCLLIVLLVVLSLGSVGLLTGYCFVKRVFESIKAD